MNNDMIGSLFPHNKWHSHVSAWNSKWNRKLWKRKKRKLFLSWALVWSDSLHFSVSCLPSELIWIPTRSPSWWGCSILGLLSEIHILMGRPCCSYCVGILLPPLHAKQAPKSHWPNAPKRCQILSGLVSSRMSLCAQGSAHKHTELRDGNGGLIHWWMAHSLHVNRDVEGAARTLQRVVSCQGSFPTNVTLLQMQWLPGLSCSPAPNRILLQVLLSLSLLQGKTLLDQGVLNPVRTLQRLLPTFHLPLELLHNLNHQVVLADSSSISL